MFRITSHAILATVFLFSWATNSAHAADRPEAPNIIVILADDWGWGDLGCHGSKVVKTPNLDQFAKDGTEFYQFSVNNPVCSPSRTAIMTGHFPARYCVHQHFASVEHHQKSGMPDWLDPTAPMLPRMLKKAGYTTAHFGKWHLTNRGIADAPLPPKYGYDESGAFNLPGVQIPVDGAFDRANDFIRRHKDKRFFMNLWIHEPHTPHYPKKEWLEKFAHLDEQHQVYAAVLADADAGIGGVLKTLAECGIEKNTLVLFTSDNGPEVTGPVARKKLTDDSTGPGLGTWYSVGSTGGLKGRKRSLHDGGIRVPFFVRWPGQVPAGRIDKTTVLTAVDLLPTLCAVAGVDLPAEYKPDGENMLGAFLGKPIARTRPIYWEWRGTHAGANWPRLGIREGPWKLLMTLDRERVELYRLPEDSGEATNVAGQHPELVKKLTDMALDWRATLPKEPAPSCLSAARRGPPKD